MSTDEVSSSDSAAGQKRAGALQIGPRKKPCALALDNTPIYSRFYDLAAEQIHWCTMVDTSDALFMPYALSALS